MRIFVNLIIVSLFFVSCSIDSSDTANDSKKGKLFIIGGGQRHDALMDRLSKEAGVYTDGNIIILPMASSVPDSAIIWSKESFLKLGIESERIKGYNFKKEEEPNKKWLKNLKEAKLIYISGGDQNQFMDIVLDSPIMDAIIDAYKNGATVAGTSAGAAVMSEKMITGDELRYEDYHSTFRTVETENIDLGKGLGLITTAIIDQHFVWRSRYNRLLTAVIEHPELLSIGIDESTAILIKGDSAEVVGVSQVLVFKNPEKSVKTHNHKLGANNLTVDIYLPGEKFSIK